MFQNKWTITSLTLCIIVALGVIAFANITNRDMLLLMLVTSLTAAIPATIASHQAEKAVNKTEQMSADMHNGVMKKVVQQAMESTNEVKKNDSR